MSAMAQVTQRDHFKRQEVEAANSEGLGLENGTVSLQLSSVGHSICPELVEGHTDLAS